LLRRSTTGHRFAAIAASRRAKPRPGAQPFVRFYKALVPRALDKPLFDAIAAQLKA
jgi:hypothetical protein